MRQVFMVELPWMKKGDQEDRRWWVGQPWIVLDKRQVWTGMYYPPSGGYDHMGENDFESGGLNEPRSQTLVRIEMTYTDWHRHKSAPAGCEVIEVLAEDLYPLEEWRRTAGAVKLAGELGEIDAGDPEKAAWAGMPPREQGGSDGRRELVQIPSDSPAGDRR